MQGYLFSEPLTGAAAFAFLHARSPGRGKIRVLHQQGVTMAQRTLARYLTEEQRDKGVITGDSVPDRNRSRACQAISVAIGKGGLGGVLGEAGSDNVQGEAHRKN